MVIKPLAESSWPVPAGQPDQGQRSGARPRVLVVDDDPDFCFSMRELLQACGHGVATAAHGGEALELLSRESFGVILTDLYMPGMDGIELIWKLRKRAEPSPPIVAVTGDTRITAPSSGLIGAATVLGARA